jgi:hypothetical protein
MIYDGLGYFVLLTGTFSTYSLDSKSSSYCSLLASNIFNLVLFRTNQQTQVSEFFHILIVVLLIKVYRSIVRRVRYRFGTYCYRLILRCQRFPQLHSHMDNDAENTDRSQRYVHPSTPVRSIHHSNSHIREQRHPSSARNRSPSSRSREPSSPLQTSAAPSARSLRRTRKRYGPSRLSMLPVRRNEAAGRSASRFGSNGRCKWRTTRGCWRETCAGRGDPAPNA